MNVTSCLPRARSAAILRMLAACAGTGTPATWILVMKESPGGV